MRRLSASEALFQGTGIFLNLFPAVRVYSVVRENGISAGVVVGVLIASEGYLNGGVFSLKCKGTEGEGDHGGVK